MGVHAKLVARGAHGRCCYSCGVHCFHWGSVFDWVAEFHEELVDCFTELLAVLSRRSLSITLNSHAGQVQRSLTRERNGNLPRMIHHYVQRCCGPIIITVALSGVVGLLNNLWTVASSMIML